MTIELRPEQEQIIHEQLATGRYGSVDEVLTTALAGLPRDRRFDAGHRREAVRRMMEFAERRKLSLGEPMTRQFLHEPDLMDGFVLDASVAISQVLSQRSNRSHALQPRDPAAH
jgi:Arc/MetJ-type ribon-helix-helix transcriptional regulator